MTLTRRLLQFALTLVLTGCLSSTADAADRGPAQAYISAGEHGQALLMSRLGECYAVTPAHVIGGDLFATLVGSSGSAPQGDGDLLQTFGYDLSILRVTGSLARECGGQLTNVPDLSRVLSVKSAANVSSVNSDGSISRRNVTLNDVGLLYVRVKPNNNADQLFKGLSGSLLLLGDRPAGILMSVDPETGEGRVLRFDRAIETLRPFFGLSGSTMEKIPERAVTQPSDSAIKASVASWNSPPIGADYRAANLVDGKGKESTWYARPEKFPVELVFQLPEGKAHAIDSLLLIGESVEPKERLPRDFEVLVSSNNQNWIPVHSGTYFKNDARKTVRFAPVKARQIMLRIYSHWGDKDALGLSAIEIPKVK